MARGTGVSSSARVCGWLARRVYGRNRTANEADTTKDSRNLHAMLMSPSPIYCCTCLLTSKLLAGHAHRRANRELPPSVSSTDYEDDGSEDGDAAPTPSLNEPAVQGYVRETLVGQLDQGAGCSDQDAPVSSEVDQRGGAGCAESVLAASDGGSALPDPAHQGTTTECLGAHFGSTLSLSPRLS
jgi:hypothetical protein